MYEKGKEIMKYISYMLENNKPSVRPKKVVKFLEDNKIVFLRTIYYATHNPPKWIVFYELFERIVPQNKRFNFYEVGYIKDFGITADCAYSMIYAIEKLGSKVRKDNLIFFDKEDYRLFIEDILGEIDFKSAKSQKYLEDTNIPIKYYKGKITKKKEIEEVMEDFRNGNVKRHDVHEEKMKNILDKLGIEYEYQKVLNVGGKFYIADFYIPKNNVIIEVDGEYHFTNKMLIKDRERDIAFAKHGVLTLRFNHRSCVYEMEAYNVLKGLLVESDL